MQQEEVFDTRQDSVVQLVGTTIIKQQAWGMGTTRTS
jgi:hypothetical protein